MFLGKKLEKFNTCSVSVIYVFKKKQLQMRAGYCCRYCRKPAAGTPQREHSAETRLSLHGRVHPPGAIINTQGTVSAAKTQMKANCSWKSQQCCSISTAATCDPVPTTQGPPPPLSKAAPPGPWAIHFPLCQMAPSVSLSESQTSTRTESAEETASKKGQVAVRLTVLQNYTGLSAAEPAWIQAVTGQTP